MLIFIIDEFLEAILNDIVQADPACHHLLIALQLAYEDVQ